MHNDGVPKVVDVAGRETPVTVNDAAQAFSSPLRLHLIKFYAEAPATQREAIKALDVSQRSVFLNTRALVDLGVLVEEELTKKQATYRTNRERLDELLDALLEFTRAPASDG